MREAELNRVAAGLGKRPSGDAGSAPTPPSPGAAGSDHAMGGEGGPDTDARQLHRVTGSVHAKSPAPAGNRTSVALMASKGRVTAALAAGPFSADTPLTPQQEKKKMAAEKVAEKKRLAEEKAAVSRRAQKGLTLPEVTPVQSVTEVVRWGSAAPRWGRAGQLYH